MVARFRMFQQIRDQTRAFISGFYSIIQRDWFDMFSVPEMLKLICGDTGTIDVDDLKLVSLSSMEMRWLNYEFCFQAERAIFRRFPCWPSRDCLAVGHPQEWILREWEESFSEGSSLDNSWRILLHGSVSLSRQFVTSCSKPPLLGFAYLEPTFSIRCVLWSDEDQEATDDSVGSLLKHIFTLSKKKNDIKRLPSAATCFNLLKLPNYESKSTLREKLRYVINSGAGFELS